MTAPVYPDIVTRTSINFDEVYTIFDGAIEVSESEKIQIPKGEITVSGSVTGTGAVSATLELWGTNKTTQDGILLATLTPSGTDSAEDSGPSPNDRITQFPYVYGKLTAISGTNAEAFLEVAV